MGEDSWSRNHVAGIMKEESSRRNMEEESWLGGKTRKIYRHA